MGHLRPSSDGGIKSVSIKKNPPWPFLIAPTSLEVWARWKAENIYKGRLRTMKTEKRCQVNGNMTLQLLLLLRIWMFCLCLTQSRISRFWQPPKVQRSILWPTWLIKETYLTAPLSSLSVQMMLLPFQIHVSCEKKDKCQDKITAARLWIRWEMSHT